jgi:uncharacterized DUF497 family protein
LADDRPAQRGESIVLFVVHTWDDETQPDPVSRIISARRAEPHERRAYDEGQF